jgi:hypothetical protein
VAGFGVLTRTGSVDIFPDALRTAMPNLRHGALPTRDCEIWTLSPSDAQLEISLREIGRLVPQLSRTKRRMPSQRPNHLAVVTLIKIGSVSALFGADLEETRDPETGWSAIVKSTSRPQIRCRVFKIPHHGSVTGHSDDVWT